MVNSEGICSREFLSRILAHQTDHELTIGGELKGTKGILGKKMDAAKEV